MRPWTGQPAGRHPCHRAAPLRTRIAPENPCHTRAVSAEEHKRQSPPLVDVRIAVVTVSDTRTEESDVGGKLVRQLCQEAGATVDCSFIVRDEPAEVASRVRELAMRERLNAVLLTGGTGIARRDTTVEALAGLFDKTLDGFGELFRMLSFQEIGSAAMLSRATAGVIGGVLVFVMPGSPKAVALAMS